MHLLYAKSSYVPSFLSTAYFIIPRTPSLSAVNVRYSAKLISPCSYFKMKGTLCLLTFALLALTLIPTKADSEEDGNQNDLFQDDFLQDDFFQDDYFQDGNQGEGSQSENQDGTQNSDSMNGVSFDKVLSNSLKFSLIASIFIRL